MAYTLELWMRCYVSGSDALSNSVFGCASHRHRCSSFVSCPKNYEAPRGLWAMIMIMTMTNKS